MNTFEMAPEQARGHSPYSKLFGAFFMAFLVAALGMYLGQYLPVGMYLPLAILEIGLIIAMIFARKRKSMSYGLMYAFMLVSGATLYFVVAQYASYYGAGLVFRAAGATTIAFGGIAIYSLVSKRDFRFLGSFLMVGTFAIIGMMILQIFFPITQTAQLIMYGFGILLFVGWTLYDFSRLTNQGFTEKEIPMIVVAIYLDLINLFLFILRFMGILSED
ncbi:Bax inhibitor-1/YccA family protein [Tuberibacillus sp. Marseille-P3662]|uniref:Bax inhibitor-1/YccA family protein n=1 Tax=Tuberibacillus sp. Marseille-P3662 TaxID=1965358 RepID=UPI000A1C7C08|nr:Bax inhibitor-1/YccA family protein [Tuberibacillus sp. Marseille-P3662]